VENVYNALRPGETNKNAEASLSQEITNNERIYWFEEQLFTYKVVPNVKTRS
jgi:hypothetical protein